MAINVLSLNEGHGDPVVVPEDLHKLSADKQKLVFVSGNFNVLHPGHLRLLNFAASCGDFLVVGVNSDEYGDALLSARYRLENVSSVGIVDYAFVLSGAPEEFIHVFQPHIVVKGKEHEFKDNLEKTALDAYGGTLLFSSGEVRFSSLDMLQRELLESNLTTIIKPLEFPARHNFRVSELVGLVESFKGCDLDLMFGFSGVLASRTDRASPKIVATDLGSASTNVDSIQSPHPCLSSASPIGTSAV